MNRQSHLHYIPPVLVIDDQFGRSGIGNALRNSVKPEVFSGYEADRRNLCINFSLADSDQSDAPATVTALARATFCAAQRWNGARKMIENAPETAVEAVRRGWPFPNGDRWALVLLDLRFTAGHLDAFGDPQDASLFGLEVLLPLLRKEFGPDLPIVVLSSTKREKNNAAARKLGALDFIQRIPGAGAPPSEGRDAIRRMLFQHGLLLDASNFIVGRSLETLKMLRQARRAAATGRNILLFGESGTGKGLLAQYIHLSSPRQGKVFETFHAAHRPMELQADELFGHWKGAFTGAISDSPGLFERANGGTVFIDELSHLDEKVQQMLMQPIEERKARRLGSPGSGKSMLLDLDVLILLATNVDVHDTSLGTGPLKHDFLNRINSFHIVVPPLRSRKDDIDLLVSHLARKLAPDWNGRFLPESMQIISECNWRNGNIRELRNTIERVLINNPFQDITPVDLTLENDHSEPSRSTTGSIKNEISPWRYPLHCLQLDPDELSSREKSQIQAAFQEGFSEMIAHSIDWSFKLTSANGDYNLTAAARLLLGRDSVSSLEAKQFIRRLLALDARKKLVALRVAERNIPQDTLRSLLEEMLKR